MYGKTRGLTSYRGVLRTAAIARLTSSSISRNPCSWWHYPFHFVRGFSAVPRFSGINNAKMTEEVESSAAKEAEIAEEVGEIVSEAAVAVPEDDASVRRAVYDLMPDGFEHEIETSVDGKLQLQPKQDGAFKVKIRTNVLTENDANEWLTIFQGKNTPSLLLSYAISSTTRARTKYCLAFLISLPVVSGMERAYYTIQKKIFFNELSKKKLKNDETKCVLF